MNPLGRHYRLLALAVLTACGAALPGCPPVVPQKPPLTQPAIGEPVPVVGNEKQFAVILMPLPDRAPLTGAALEKARTLRPQITLLAHQAAATRNSPPPATEAASAPESHDPPPAALKAYLAGREKFVDGNNVDAIDLLQKALKIDPDSFSALRLIGRAYFATGELARGSVYLQHAAAIDPTDVDVNYLLGRYWLEQKEWPTAIHYLITADESPQRTDASSLAPLSSFYLARAFQQAGYHQAAAEEYQRFLMISQQPVPAYHLDPELAVLLELRWTVELETAENYFLAGRFAEAQGHYLAAVRDRPDDAYAVSRLLFNEVIQGDFTRATAHALALVSAAKASDDSISLLEWVYRCNGRQNQVLADLQSQAQDPKAGSSTALALAKMQQRQVSSEAAVHTLTAFLAGHPADLDVLGRLVQMVVDAKAYDTDAFVRTAGALAAAPDKAEAIMGIYNPLLAPANARRLENAVRANQWPQGHKTEIDGGMEHYLYGQSLRNTPDTRQADAEFAAAVAAAPTFWPARESSITVLVEREKFADAEALIKDANTRGLGGIKSRQIMIAVKVAEQRYAEAQTLAEQAMNDFPDQPDFRTQLASIDRLRQHPDAAVAELKRAVERFPTVEKVYRPLVQLYVTRGQLNDAGALLGTLLRNIPTSRYGRLTGAQLCAALGRAPEAEGLLRNLLTEQPTDPDANIQLAALRYAGGKAAEAETILNDTLKANPANTALVEALATMLRDQRRAGDAVALTEKYTTENPDSDLFLLMHVNSLLGAQRLPEAESLLKQGLARLPQSTLIASSAAEFYEGRSQPQDAVDVIEHFLSVNGETAEQLYVLSHYQFQAGDDAGSNRTLERALKLMPDHIGANNDLGFFWADQGKNLDQSEAMIKKALDNQPDNPAYVDSLAWVYYKRGEFDKAIAQLERAIGLPGGKEPDIMGHLGDALYRAGKTTEARDRWQDAHSLLPENVGPPLDKLRIYLDDALKAVAEHRPPVVSPLAPGAATQP